MQLDVNCTFTVLYEARHAWGRALLLYLGWYIWSVEQEWSEGVKSDTRHNVNTDSYWPWVTVLVFNLAKKKKKIYSTDLVAHCQTLRSPIGAEGGGRRSASLSLLTLLPQCVFITAAWEQGAVISLALSRRYRDAVKCWNAVLNQMELQAIVLFIPAMNEPSHYAGRGGEMIQANLRL